MEGKSRGCKLIWDIGNFFWDIASLKLGNFFGIWDIGILTFDLEPIKLGYWDMGY